MCLTRPSDDGRRQGEFALPDGVSTLLCGAGDEPLDCTKARAGESEQLFSLSARGGTCRLARNDALTRPVGGAAGAGAATAGAAAGAGRGHGKGGGEGEEEGKRERGRGGSFLFRESEE